MPMRTYTLDTRFKDRHFEARIIDDQTGEAAEFESEGFARHTLHALRKLEERIATRAIADDDKINQIISELEQSSYVQYDPDPKVKFGYLEALKDLRKAINDA